MNSGYLSRYFESVAAKRLSAVEVNTERSNQHEFNGSKELKKVLRTEERTQFAAKFLWMGEENEGLSVDGLMTWYDAREQHPIRSEYRFYFPSNDVMRMASEGDTLFIARRTDNTILIIITPARSTIENQLLWLFGVELPANNRFQYSDVSTASSQNMDFPVRYILEELGIEVEEPENERLDSLLSRFYGRFPSVIDFSKFARETITIEFNAVDDPDGALLTMMEWEEKLFRRLERHIVSSRLQQGFNDDGETDVDGFMSFSLSVQNRRKSRAGAAFEEHVAFILDQNAVKNSRKKITENNEKPDFILPHILFYKNEQYPTELLTLLAAKTSCKERWGQVLKEAKRIKRKHLITIEPGISENQTQQMEENALQLVVPKGLQTTYTSNQQTWLMDFKQFIIQSKDRESQSIRLGFSD